MEEPSRLITMLFALKACLCVAAVAAFAGGIAEKAVVDWDFSRGDAQGWTALHAIAPLTVKDGLLQYRIEAGDPYAGSPAVSVPTARFQYFVFELQSNVPGSVQIFWLVGDDPKGMNFTEAESARFEISGDEKLHRYIVLAPWREGKRFFRLRLDAPDGIGKLLQIRRVALMERTVPGPLPTRPDYDLGNAGIAAAWLPLQGIEAVEHDGQQLVCRTSGGMAAIAGPEFELDAAKGRWLSAQMAPPAGCHEAEVWYQVGPFDTFEAGLRLRFDVAPDGQLRWYNIDLSKARAYEGTVRRVAIAFVDAASGVPCRIRSVRLLPQPGGSANVWAASFGPIYPVLNAGEPNAIEAVVRNDGGAAAAQVKAKLVCEGEVTGEAEPAIASLPSGGEATVRWKARFQPRAKLPQTKLELLLNGEIAGRREAVVSLPAGSPEPPEPGKRTFSLAQKSGPICLRNGHLSLVVPMNDYGYGAVFLLDANAQSAAWFASLGSLTVLAPARAPAPLPNETLQHEIYASEGELEVTEERQVLTLRSQWEGPPGRQWRAAHTFALKKDQPVVEMSAELLCSGEADIAAFRAPTMLTSGVRDVGLFCGLEYLLPGERSNGTDFAAWPTCLRFAPHPNRVTIPLMAILRGGLATGVMWNPLQKWDGAHDRPTAHFASPDRTKGVDEMTLFVPSVPEWLDENTLEARKPYRLKSGAKLVLSAEYFVVPAKDIDAPLKLYLSRTGGLPALPERPYGYEDSIRAVMTEYTKTAWIAEKGIWNQTINNPWQPAFLASHATHMLWELRRDRIQGPLRAATSSVLDAAIKKLQQKNPDDPGGPEMLYHQAQITPAALRQRFTRPHPHVAGLRDDGSFPFEPSSPRHRLFGKPGDTSSGATAGPLWAIWQDALATGEPRTIAAGLKGLEYLDKCMRPEGAQVWELDLHVPDVLAAAHAIRCYVAAYRITGRDPFREKAVLWAYRGLPFIYLWNPPDRPIMRYGSIPVFGATWYSGGWYGRIVQWNGLEYADALLDLSSIDKSCDWPRIVEGILISAIQQQRPIEHDTYKLKDAIPNCGHAGMYPDAYCPITGTDAYPWCLSGDRIASLTYRILGEDPSLHAEVVRAADTPQRVHINTVAQIKTPAFQRNELTFEVGYPKGNAHGMVIANCPPVASVAAEPRKLLPVDDLPASKEGFVYDAEAKLLFLKLDQTAPTLKMSIQLK